MKRVNHKDPHVAMQALTVSSTFSIFCILNIFSLQIYPTCSNTGFSYAYNCKIQIDFDNLRLSLAVLLLFCRVNG